VIAALVLVSLAAAGYLGHRWLGERAANQRLRAEVAMLKRRLRRAQ